MEEMHLFIATATSPTSYQAFMVLFSGGFHQHSGVCPPFPITSKPPSISKHLKPCKESFIIFEWLSSHPEIMKVKSSASHLLQIAFFERNKSITPKSVVETHIVKRQFAAPFVFSDTRLRHLPIQRSARLEHLETPGFLEEQLKRNHFEDESFPSHLDHFLKQTMLKLVSDRFFLISETCII